jgi:CheY-like chemotaxis protein
MPANSRRGLPAFSSGAQCRKGLRAGTNCQPKSLRMWADGQGQRMTNAEANLSVSIRTILVVDDEVLVRLAICDALRDAGLRIVEAANADEALLYVRTDPTVELVFSDVRMPGTMDGIALARRLKAEYPHIAVVLASGHLLPRDVETETPLFLKPYPIEETASYLIAILDKKGSAA